MTEHDGPRSYDLAIEALREINIRRGRILPRTDRPDEQRWAKEGEIPNHRLETVRVAVNPIQR